jgi:hypothetical protein
MPMTTRMRRGLLLLAACVLPAGAAAQETPEEVAVAYYEHYRDGRLREMTALTHPRALESFKAAIVAALEGNPDPDPAMDADVLRSLPADSVYLLMISASAEENRFAAMLGDVRMEPLGHLPQGDSLAHVVYVGRGTFAGVEAAQTMAMTLRRHQGRWLVDPGDSLLGMLGGSVMYLMVMATMDEESGFTAPHP